jgi:hypothetical protein
MLDVSMGESRRRDRGLSQICTLYEEDQEQIKEVYQPKNANKQIKKWYTFQTTYFIPI